MAKRRKAPTMSGQDYAKQVLSDEYNDVMGRATARSLGQVGLGAAATVGNVEGQKRAAKHGLGRFLVGDILKESGPMSMEGKRIRDGLVKSLEASDKKAAKWNALNNASTKASWINLADMGVNAAGFWKGIGELNKAEKRIASDYPAIQQAKATNEAIKFNKSKTKRSK